MIRCIAGSVSFHIHPQIHHHGRRLTSTMSFAPSTSPLQEVLRAKLSGWIAWYDEITGLQDVVWAQNRVLELEQQVLISQSERREVSRSLDVLRTKMRELNSELENTTRGDDKYVHIVTQEHRLLKEEKQLTEQLKFIENGERDLFSALSAAVRESHEKERARAERTKYWSIIGTLIGSVFGVVGSTINNRVKLRELKSLVEDTAHLRRDVSQDIEAILLKTVQKEESSLSRTVQSLLSGKIILNDRSDNISHVIVEQAENTRIVVMAGFVATILVYVCLFSYK